jgi:hypothetical protein
MNAWKGTDEFVVIRQALIDASLLQNYFAKPYLIRIFGVSPGQVALVIFIPIDQDLT